MGDESVRPARFLRVAHIAVALIPAFVLVLSVTGFVWAHKGVTLVVEGDHRFMKTQAATVGDLLREADVALGDSDVAAPPVDAAVTDGMTVTVRRAVPVTVRVSGEPLELDVIGATVTDALVAAGVDPSRGVSVEPPLDTPLTPGLVVDVTDVFMRVIEETTDVPYEVVTENDASLPRGTRAVRRAGEPGVVMKVYRVLVTAGAEGPRTLTAEYVVSPPVDEVVAVGTKRSGTRVAVSRERAPAAGALREGTRMTVVATGYTTQDPGVDTRTATGVPAVRGVMAVDPAVIPFGTRVYVPGYGTAVAADTGGAIDGAKIDLCFDTRAEAFAWGRRTVTVTILP
ncbi:MAG TPA: 3D domain-containing protein [Coriobacteriia bacterium]|nr:3D domain-containing protein [Coriobacteriia bacterium]